MDPVLEWDWADIAYFVFTALTGIGVLAIGMQIIGERTARHREFENMYVQRYWSISSRLPTRFIQGHSDYTMNEDGKSAMYDYLLLCEDEMDLRKRGYITDQTWQIWMSGIFFTITDLQCKELIDNFPKGRLEHLRKLSIEPLPSFDPIELGKVRRWWTGLS